MSAYKHIFFDLDKTLWDIDRNSEETLLELSEKYDIVNRGVSSVTEFIKQYRIINEQFWLDYMNNKVDKTTLRYGRFRKAFNLYGIEDDELFTAFGNDYTSIAPLKKNLLPHTIELLDYLLPKYELHIITNGFEEVQTIKLEHSKLKPYFKEIITSEKAGYKKPDSRIFTFSMSLTGATTANSIMIGDNLEADIIGARGAGIDQVYFNPERALHGEEITFEIMHLKELIGIL